MAINEVVRTTGDLRRNLSDILIAVTKGEVEVSRAQAAAQLAKEINSSMLVEINAAKVNIALTQAGKSMGEVRHMGKMLIGDDSTPTLNRIE